MCTPSRRLLSRTFKFVSSAGAVAALLAMPSLASAQEGRANDELFTLNRAVAIPGSPLVAFDISWFEPR